MKKTIIFLLLFMFLIPVKAEEDMAPNSKSAILIENSTGKIIYEKNAHEKLAPASMTKLMTMLLVMEELEAGRLKETDIVTISEKASRMGGSQIFLQTGSKISVKDLIKGITIASANDASVAIAEKISGTDSKFIDLMNKRSKELQLKNTHFKNAHGLDDDDHYSTAHDMAIIALELIKHPQILEYTSIYEEYLTKDDGTQIWLVNTNKLVRFYEGIDGLKTGYTTKAGYCLTATGKKENLRYIATVMGADTSPNRNSDIVNMMNYGFNSFKLNTIIEKDKELGKIKINQGKNQHGTLILLEEATELLKNTEDAKKYDYDIKTKKKITAPIKTGDQVGTLELKDEKGKVIKKINLTIKENIKKANFLDYLKRNLKQTLSGNSI